MISFDTSTDADEDLFDALAAEITDAVYPLAFMPVAHKNWLDVKLALWKSLSANLRDRALVLRPGTAVGRHFDHL